MNQESEQKRVEMNSASRPSHGENNRFARLPHFSYDRSMKTLTIRVPDFLIAEIERESKLRCVSKSDMVRERLHQTRLALPASGSMSDTIGDVLEECWVAKVPAGPPRFRSLKKQKLAAIIRAKKLHN